MELYRSKDLDVEECLALGRAIGTVLGHDAVVVTARDGVPVSRLAKRAIVIGIAASGCSVLDLRLAPELLLRFSLERGHGEAGVYVGYEAGGLLANLHGREAASWAPRIREVLGRRAFARVPLGALGGINLYPNAVDDYVRASHKKVDFLKHLRVLVDCQNRPISLVALPLFESYGMKVVLANDQLTTYQEPQGREAFVERFRGGEFTHGIRLLGDAVELHYRDGRVEEFAGIEPLLLRLARPDVKP